MPTAPQIIQELKEALPLGLDIVFQKLKNYMPKEAGKYNELLLLESRYRSAHKAYLEDTEEAKDIRQEFNRIRKALLTFIDGLEEKDFEKAKPDQPKAKPQRGSLLYRIPNAMEVEKETKCLVRIAFTEAILLEALTQEEDDVIQSLRVSEVMGVELIDPNDNAPFQIRTYSETVQLIYKEDYTEWIFYVKPLRVGEYALLLKVSVVEMRQGKERKRNIVLEEKVVITTETVQEAATGFKSADYAFVTGTVAPTGERTLPTADIGTAPAPPKPKKVGWLRRISMMLASLLLLVSVSYAAIPAVEVEIDWLVARVQDSKEAYQSFAKKHQKRKEQSRRVQQKVKQAEQKVETIEWEEAIQDSTKTEVMDYLQKYPATGVFLQEAENLLEDLVWKEVEKDTSAKAVVDYLETYGNTGRYLEQAKKRAEKLNVPNIENLVIMPQDTTSANRENTDLENKTNTSDMGIDNTSNKENTQQSIAEKEVNQSDKKIDKNTLEANPVVKDASLQEEPPKEQETTTSNPQSNNPNDKSENSNAPNKDTITNKEDTINNTLPKNKTEKKLDEITKEAIKNMVYVQGGTFIMGCTEEQTGDCDDDEKPAHEVTLSSFYISKYEVTFEQYDAYCDATGTSKPDDEGWGRGKRPVFNVSWNNAVAYCKWLSEKTGKSFRLPTEAEWEFAARRGKKSKKYKYAGSNALDKVAWHYGNSGNKTHPVGQKQKNELGLYDMSGNVFEWCEDWYGDYKNQKQTNPKGVASGSTRVLRGGSWGINARLCRVANRISLPPDSRDYRLSHCGFRLAHR